VREHVVRGGDTLWEISQRYNVRISDLRRWNGMLVDDVLRIGERLRVAAPPGESHSEMKRTRQQKFDLLNDYVG